VCVYLPETVVTMESTPNLHDTYASWRAVTVLRRPSARRSYSTYTYVLPLYCTHSPTRQLQVGRQREGI
jgi:hypothetical protein